MKQQKFYDELKKATLENGNKIPYAFIQEQVAKAKIVYTQTTDNTRVCTMTMETGHEVVGVARVLDAKNDEEKIGNSVALENATNELWATYGSIAKLFI